MSVLFDGVEISSCKPKVSKFDVQLILLVDKDILRFEISMDDSVGMTEFQSK